MSLVLYLAQITLVSAVTVVVYLSCRNRLARRARQFLAGGLACVLLVSTLAVFPAYEIACIPSSDPLSSHFARSVDGASESVATNDSTDLAGLLVKLLVAVVALRLAFLALELTSLVRLSRRGKTISNGRLTEICRQLAANMDSTSGRDRHRQPRFVVSSEVSTAATLGVLNPVVLLPAKWTDWQDDQLRAVLAHELEHIRRSDFLFRTLAELVRVIHFYHPCITWLVDQFRIEQECAADLAAIKHTSLRQYESLLAQESLGKYQSRQLGLAPSFSAKTKSLLRKRIEMLRARKRSPVTGGTRLSLLAIAFLIPLSLIVSGIQVDAESTELPGNPEQISVHTDAPTGTQDTQPGSRVVNFSVNEYFIIGGDPSEIDPAIFADGKGTTISETFNYTFGTPGTKQRSSQ